MGITERDGWKQIEVFWHHLVVHFSACFCTLLASTGFCLLVIYSITDENHFCF